MASLALALFASTVGTYWQVRNFDFVGFDDGVYVSENRAVRAGLTVEGWRWAWTSAEVNWHPLTWLSHMLDCQLFGLNPGAHHLVNVLLHAANVILLFLVLRRMTGAVWPSAFVAALFGLHPLHVESVAWIAERKDVLSTFFWMLTMWAYASYAERPGIKRYMAVVVTLALGLLSKPMLVTLPCVLLLLDYWPLQRFRATPARQLLWEKAPMFVLVAAVSVVTVLAQKQMGALGSLEVVPLQYRVANAVVGYADYLGKMLWPTNLAVFYPHPLDQLPWWRVLTAALLLAGCTFAVMRLARRHPYLVVGWLWFLGTLVPVIQLVQMGRVAIADRYTYVPLIGIFLMLAWGVPDLLAGWRNRQVVLASAAAVALAVLTGLTWVQIGYWRDSVTLFQHALAVTEGNYMAHNNLGHALETRGMLDQAAVQYEAALREWPGFAIAHRNLGAVLDRKGKTTEALQHLTAALRIDPNDPKAYNNLGIVLTKLGKLDAAAEQFSQALRLDPDNAKAHNNLGDVLTRLGRLDEAATHLSAALRLEPHYANAHNNAGVLLLKQGKPADAARHFSEALRLQPNHGPAQRNLALARKMQSGGTLP